MESMAAASVQRDFCIPHAGACKKICASACLQSAAALVFAECGCAMQFYLAIPNY